MKTIHKVILSAEDLQLVTVPRGSRFLHANAQNDNICIWFECETDAELDKRKIAVYGTGHEMPKYKHEYIGTVMMHNGSLVFHVFEVEFF